MAGAKSKYDAVILCMEDMELSVEEDVWQKEYLDKQLEVEELWANKDVGATAAQDMTACRPVRNTGVRPPPSTRWRREWGSQIPSRAGASTRKALYRFNWP